MKELLASEPTLLGIAQFIALIGLLGLGAKQKFEQARTNHKLESVKAVVQETRAEVTPNHGSSVKDGVNRTETAVSQVSAKMEAGFAKLMAEIALTKSAAERAIDATKSNAHQIGEVRNTQIAQYSAMTDRLTSVERRVDTILD